MQKTAQCERLKTTISVEGIGEAQNRTSVTVSVASK